MENTTNHTLQWNEFEKVEMRIGTILEARDFPEARKPAYQLAIDFGNEIGIRKSSAQITKRYAIEDMVGKQVVAVVNFPKKQIGNFMSECLVLGSVNGDDIVLLTSDLKVENGLRVG
jgi:tRNA-binding protein